MSYVVRPRPILASVICFYEGVMVFLAVMGFALVHAVRIANPALQTASTSTVQLACKWIGYALAVGIIVTLWQMRREAFYLAAAKLCLVILGIVYSFMHPRHVAGQMNRVGQPHISLQAFGAIGILIIVISLSINAAITFYINDVTRPIWSSEP